jgi:prephenate dehydrogenase
VIDRLAIVGLGLLGGSVAKAARASALAREIVAIGRATAGLEPARREGVVDRITADLGEGLAGADLCVLATPVTTLEGLLPSVWEKLPEQALVTDVGSTKARIVATADRLARCRPLRFVGAHPMAGSERSGYPASAPDLFRDAVVVVTPTEHTEPDALQRVTAFWQALGGRVVTLDPGTHDRAVAAVSHLPHLVAEALVDAVTRMDVAFLDLAGRGFKDTTRVAAANATVWREIFQDNRVGLGEAVAAFRKSLDHLEALVTGPDAEATEAELQRIRRVREGLE